MKTKDKITGRKAAILRKTAQDIIEHSVRFIMGDWVVTNDSHAPCKTAACIAGFMCMNEQLPKSKSWRRAGLTLENKFCEEEFDFGARATQIAGLTLEESNALFFTYNWPEEFESDYQHFEDKADCESPYSRHMKAHIAAARIEHFIKTGE